MRKVQSLAAQVLAEPSTRSPRNQRQRGIGHNARMETPRPAATAEFLPPPAAGRVFTAGYPIQRTDVTPDGRLRLDALARDLQDVAEDDVADSGLAEPCDWLVRRCARRPVAACVPAPRGPRRPLAAERSGPAGICPAHRVTLEPRSTAAPRRKATMERNG